MKMNYGKRPIRMKELLITSGYPRSGNNYLNQALNLMYYPKDQVNWVRHTTKAIDNAEKIMVPFRNPLDSISSWHNYPSNGSLTADVNYYLRFYSSVLQNLNKVVLMYFDYFINGIDYIKNKTLKYLQIKPLNEISHQKVIDAMVKNGKEMNLPRNDKEQLLQTKTVLSKVKGFTECLKIHNILVEQAL